MANFIYSKTTDKDKQSFYLVNEGQEYYLFTQKFYKGVKDYFHNKIYLSEALDMTKARFDTALIRTKSKLPLYIRHLENEFGIIVLQKTHKRNAKTRKDYFRRDSYENYSCEYGIA